MDQQRHIIHVDMDAFYASVEMLDNPALRGRPVIVGGTPQGRGVVCAASYEARAFGVHSAMSAARAHTLCPQGVFLSPRFERYAEISEAIHQIFSEYSPLVEPLSLDEAFLDVTGCERLFGSAVQIGREIKRRIKDELGLTASVGVAPNKLLAKMGSDLDKPDGFVVIEPERVLEVLRNLPVGRLWGVGKVTQEMLSRLRIETIGDLWTFPPEVLEERLGPHARALLALSRGEDDRPVVVGEEPKSISEETTFSLDIADEGELLRCLDGLSAEVARRLRKKGYRARTVQLKARYPDFTTVTRAMTLPSSVCATRALQDLARQLFNEKLGRRGRALRLLGFGVSNLERPQEAQLELFPDPKAQRSEKLDVLMDRLQVKYGRGAVGHGATPPEDLGRTQREAMKKKGRRES